MTLVISCTRDVLGRGDRVPGEQPGPDALGKNLGRTRPGNGKGRHGGQT
jgi:hypothetical protein